MKLLLIEDDPETADYVRQGLLEEAHDLHVAVDGRGGLFRAVGEDWDLLIVDRMIPGVDGLALVQTLRAGSIGTPVLFLTTMEGIDDRVSGLNAGADDYLVKPFAFAELAARLNALGRRSQRLQPGTTLKVADLEADMLTRQAQRSGRWLELQPREFQLLVYLMGHAGQVVTRTMLLENVWDIHFDTRTNIVDSHMSRLRAKLDNGGAELIHTIRGAGYMIRAPE